MLWESELSFSAIKEAFFKMVTEMIIQAQMLKGINALKSIEFGGIGDIISSLFHDGGVVGEGSAPTRSVSPLAFVGAPQISHRPVE